MIGTGFGQYTITSHLGSGGMGDVYQATDSRLGRDVAVKFLSESFVHDSSRLARFQREARALAALNHPNIATIHGFEEVGGRHFLVMELVRGTTLATQLARGRLALDDTIRYGTQIADALAAAHARGIVHRDLKPGNIMVTKSGVKVLDFGLASHQPCADARRLRVSHRTEFIADNRRACRPLRRIRRQQSCDQIIERRRGVRADRRSRRDGSGGVALQHAPSDAPGNGSWPVVIS